MEDNQLDSAPPIDPSQKRKTESLLPKFYRSDSNKKFIAGTIDQLIQGGTVKRLNGFIGRENSKATTAKDIFLQEPLIDRQNYQLEPGLVIEDSLGNVTFFKDYLDHINTLNVLGGITSNHQRINQQEFYSWEPHIDWDKIVNYLHYYWLPLGPEIITIYGQQQGISSTFTVTLSDEGDNRAFLFTPDGLTRNPALTLYRGQTYRFEINTPGEPFSIKTQREIGKNYRYLGIDEYAVEKGVITFTVPLRSPDFLYYVSENSLDTAGIIKIFDIKENTAIDVESEILNKKTYQLPSGVFLSNGMKVNFKGRVTPKLYSEDVFYVEGVGERIQLISERQLEIVAPSYSKNYEVVFDGSGFDDLPYNDILALADQKDYITINRASTDRNPWTRYNRWVHADIIQKTAEHLGKQAVFDQTQRAKRPIIEFNANIKLYNFGIFSKRDIDLVDDFTNDIFSTIEGSLGYNIDGIQLLDGHRILFTADKDPLVKNKIFRVEFVLISDNPENNIGTRKVHLVEEEDSTPLLEQTVMVKNGINYKSKHLWYNGTNWVIGQTKTSQNQAPLFDLFDRDEISITDIDKYQGSSFTGNKIFSYKIGTGTIDSELGFPLTYKNINNIGDILFNYDLLQNTFSYKDQTNIITEQTDNKFLKKYSKLGNEYLNGWTKNVLKNVQPIVRIYKNKIVEKVVDESKTPVVLTNNFPIDVYDDITNLDDLLVKVYINGKRLNKNKFTIEDSVFYKQVILFSDIDEFDVLTLKCYSKQNKNNNGHYELPINFQNNPLNDNINNFTLGEVIDHVDSIIDNLDSFNGDYPGVSNLRDLSNISGYGIKFVQHSGSLNSALYHLNIKDNLIKALESARDDYGTFKRNFVNHINELTSELPVKDLVDLVLFEINDGRPKNVPYYFSDMLAYGASKKTSFTVQDYRVKKYPISSLFNLDQLSNKSVNIYLNENQLLYERDYKFGSNNFVEILIDIQENDILTVYEYETTDGCYIPPTPTSLGLYPKFEPKIYLDITLVRPQMVIQGHDGSIILAFNDYRDDLILELEKRFFNNIKIKYNPNLLDIYDFIPGFNRPTPYSIDEFNQILAPNFYQWLGFVDQDFTKPLKSELNNPFTYNYGDCGGVDGADIPAFWRGIYKWYFDTDRIHLTPWESLGFSMQPIWWEDTYGPAPYTSNNLILWQDLRDGVIKEPGKPIIRNLKFAKPILEKIPVGEDGNLLNPIQLNLIQGTVNKSGTYVFGDQAPVESAWRRSSYYPFSLLITMILMQPARVLSTYLDRSRIIKNKNDQLIYSETGVRLRLKDLLTSNTVLDSTRTLTSGLINYVIDYLQGDNTGAVLTYRADLKAINNKLSYRLAGFTSKEKFNLILDSKSSSSKSGVLIPKENYNIFLNTSSPTKKILYSGVIVTKVLTNTGIGYEIKGYSQTAPYFYYYKWTQSGYSINVGGISESFIVWESDQQYVSGNIVRINGAFYRVKTTHTSSTNPSFDILQKIPALPIVGGANALIRKQWDRIPVILSHGTTLNSIQEVVDFLLGHSEYLKDQGFAFDQFNTALNSVTSWETSVKEFLFWTTQNWSAGTERYAEWDPEITPPVNSIILYDKEFYKVKTDTYLEWKINIQYKKSSVVRFNNGNYNDYYRLKQDHKSDQTDVNRNQSTNLTYLNSSIYQKLTNSLKRERLTDEFNPDLYTKVDGLNQDGASAISLSPGALRLDLNLKYATVADLREHIGSYEMFLADGQKYEPSLLKYSRYSDAFSLEPRNQSLGIYGAALYLIQKEHVLIIDNVTQFNDLIYSLETGYRQERILISGYKTLNWNGSLDAPGFIYDRAHINDWAPWVDYNLGDIVKYKEFYYSASKFLPGQEEFNKNDWISIENRPSSQLLPNWDYKALQFTDFYDLDSDNFDINQQKIAQHLIGYQKREYLSNIIKNDVSEFKFYQGMIQEKGTLNSLNKLFDVLSASSKDSIDFVEEWAIRSGQYGASDAFEEIEFILDEGQFKNNPQAIELVSSIDSTLVDFVIRQTKNNIYLKPKFYQNDLWPINKNYKPFLRTPGFVKFDQIKLALDSKNELLTKNVDNFVSGDYIWCAFEDKIHETFKDDWNVYRFSIVDYIINKIEYTNNKLYIHFENVINLVPGQIIGIKSNYDKINSFYEINAINDNKIVEIIIKIIDFKVPSSDVLKSIKIHIISEQRFQDIDSVIMPNYLKSKELVWINHSINGKYAIWSNDPVFSRTKLYDESLQNKSKFGRRLAINETTMAVSVILNSDLANYSEQISIYVTTPTSSNWVRKQTINIASGLIVRQLIISDDNNWLAISIKDTINKTGLVQLYQKDFYGYNYINEDSIVDTDIYNPDLRFDEHFGHKIKFTLFNNDYLLTISSLDRFNTPDKIYFYKSTTSFLDNKTSWSNKTFIWQDENGDVQNFPLSLNFDINEDSSIISLVSGTENEVLIYERTNNDFRLIQTLNGSNLNNVTENLINFGRSITLSKTGKKLAISGVKENDPTKHVVEIYSKSTNYTRLQRIENRNNEPNDEAFGFYTKFVNNEKTLIVFSLKGDSSKNSLFNYDDSTLNFDKSRINIDNTENNDENELINFDDSTAVNYYDSTINFDDNIINYYDINLIINPDSGRVDIYDMYDKKFIYSESLSVDSSQAEGYGTSIDASDNIVVVSAPLTENSSNRTGAVYTYKRNPNNYSWKIDQEETPRIDLSVFKKIFLYNKKTNQLITYLDIIDPTQGKISGIADRQIKYKTYYDPATYSFQSATSSIEVVVEDGMAWIDAQVGTLWWDLRRAKFLDAHLSDVVYKNTIWNTLYDTASIDIYEWVSSRFVPSNWDKLADTNEGMAQGISGKTLYGDEVYSIKRTYDTVAKTFTSTYYYWVKNKTTIPNISSRTNSAADIANIISNPKGAALKYIQFTNSNSFSLTNVKDLLLDRDTLLAVQYWTIPNHEINIHSEWKIISENEKTEIPKNIERKWVDSLVGFDENGKMVPDLTLPPKQRFGIESKPRQSMFINRIEAVKQVIERINKELKNIQIDNIDLTDLLKKDLPPTLLSGEYDYIVDSENELRFINTTLFKKPTLSLSIKNGTIIAVNIDNTGFGYGKLAQIEKNISGVHFKGPTIEIEGKGAGAVIDVSVNSYGALNPIEILNGGKGYDIETTTVTVRPLSVLVRSDSSIFGNWAIYSYDSDALIWNRIKLQYYDVTAFWNYIDWYGSYVDPMTNREQTFNQYSKIDHAVDSTYELFTLESKMGQTIKVNNTGNAGWMLLVKYSDIKSLDYTQTYKIVGRHNGSIQISSNFYNYKNNNLGYDSELYDNNKYDNSGTTELRIILNTLKDKILIDDRRILYLNLLFLSIRYALYEQPYLDWVFKSSFVKALHNLGNLRQKVTYSNDNLENFENYIDEVKPYRTKIREFISGYTNIDNSQSMITDFDLPSYVNENGISSIGTMVTDSKIQLFNKIVNDYPWKLWKDNIGFSVKEIIIADGGNGYTSSPLVKIIGHCTKTAKARAFISKTQVIKVEILDEGAGYLTAPTIVLEGHLSVNGTPARAVAIIKNELIRNNITALKFDRYTKQNISDVLPLTKVDSFNGDGKTVTFDLSFSPNTSEKVLVKFIIDRIAINVPTENYNIIKISSKEKDHTVYYAQITFDTPPSTITEITVDYKKDFKHLSALERITHYYDPSNGMIGKDFTQLMSGIDYGGVNIAGSDFDKPLTSWDSDNSLWDSNDWDNYDETEDAVKFNFRNDSSRQYTLPYTPKVGELINVYISKYNSTATINISAVNISPLDNNSVWITTLTDHGFTANMSVSISSVTKGNYNGTYRIRQLISKDKFSITLDRAVKLGTGGTVLGYTYDSPVRIDDPNFVSYPLVDNPHVVMNTFIGNGTTKVIILPDLTNYSELDITENDFIIFRKTTSDGSVNNPKQYDTLVIGGDFERGPYASAMGLEADEIILDGDGFISPLVSPAPEEMLPGHVVDTLVIKVTDSNRTGSSNINCANYYSDGIESVFKIGQQPNSKSAVIVKLNDNILKLDVDYTIDFDNLTITLIQVPEINQIVSIISLGINGSNILFTGHVIPAIATDEILTECPWRNVDISALVLVSGEIKNYTLFNFENKVAIKLVDEINPNQLVNYIIFEAGIKSTSSIVSKETITIKENTLKYNLINPIGNLLPLEYNAIVKIGNEILNSVDSFSFVLKNQIYEYDIPLGKDDINKFSVNDFKVYIDNIEVFLENGFKIFLLDSIIEIMGNFYIENAKVVVVIKKNTEYTIGIDKVNYIEFKKAYPINTEVEIISMFNHDILDIRRTDYEINANVDKSKDNIFYFDAIRIGAAIITLPAPISDPSYAWVIQNKILLTPKIDYILDQKKDRIILNKTPLESDKFSVITFSNNIIRDSISFMQFKDMLNRVHYRRISQNRTTFLTEDLRYYDKQIVIDDPTCLNKPRIDLNDPGVIYVNGERIEYFIKTGNILSQLRRGTWGTGIPTVHTKFQAVLDISSTETVPYQDIEETTVWPPKEYPNALLDDSTSLIELPYVPNKDSIEVFVGGTRQRKDPYKLHNPKLHPESPEGDSEYPADFTVDNLNPQIRLENVPKVPGIRIQVIRKTLTVWNDLGKTLADSTNNVAYFLKTNPRKVE
jgi:hypothetical protein